ncbi:MAG: PAS domain-containing protein [Gemmatimonadetes bacterium]|nr:PAS domain-containing protein [Gemmatimonadota bacterium]
MSDEGASLFDAADPGDAALRALPSEVLASIIANLDDAVGVFDADGVVLWANAACRRATGVQLGARLGDAFIARHQIVNEDGQPTPAGELTMLAALRTGKPASARVRGFTAQDGAMHWVRVRTSPFFSAGGAVAGAVMVFSDITEHVIADRERRELAQRLETVLGTMSDGIFVVDEHGVFTYANAAALRIMGYAPEEFLGRRIEDTQVRRFTVDGQPVAVADHPVSRAVATGETVPRTTLRYEGLPTGTKWLESSVTTMRDADGHSRGIVVSFSDVTERLAMQEQRRHAEQNLQAILGATLSAIMMIDPGGRIVYANEAAARVIGRPRADIEGSPLDDARLAIYDDTGWPIAREKRPLWIAMHEGRTVENVVVATRRADGTRWLAVNAAPIMGDDGKPRAAVASFVDITDRRLLNEQLQQSQKMEGIGRLAGGIAHDFNNIITAILGNVDFALEGVAPDSDLARDLDQVREAAQRGAALTRQLLTFARRQPVNPQPVRLDRLAVGMDRMLRRVLGEDIKFETQSDADLWPVRADASQMEQVILNFAVNAREAMPNGGTLTVEARNHTLTEREAARWPDAKPGDFVTLTVSDTGVGMTAAVKERIFEPFFTTRPIGTGTGLGLSTVYGIVQDAGGFIGVESEPDKGTTFRVYLPRTDGVVEPARKPSDVAAEKGSGTILVVEDETVVRQLVERSLRAYGYTVLTAADGREALDIAAKSGSDIDLVITDVIMPGLSGTDLAARLRDERPGLPVLFMSGYPDHARMSSPDIPAERLLQKPFTPAQLAHRVHEALERGR